SRSVVHQRLRANRSILREPGLSLRERPAGDDTMVPRSRTSHHAPEHLRRVGGDVSLEGQRRRRPQSPEWPVRNPVDDSGSVLQRGWFTALPDPDPRRSGPASATALDPRVFWGHGTGEWEDVA